MSALEFGCEANFIAVNDPTPVGTEQIGDKTFNVYRVAANSDAVEILEQSGTSTPAFARYYHQGKLVESLQYELYATGLTNDLDLFSRPLGVRYIEELPTFDAAQNEHAVIPILLTPEQAIESPL